MASLTCRRRAATVQFARAALSFLPDCMPDNGLAIPCHHSLDASADFGAGAPKFVCSVAKRLSCSVA
jgi:hypothetical protein